MRTELDLARTALIHDKDSRAVADGPAVVALQQVIAHFEPVGLAEIEGAALMNRTDTKYLVSEYALIDVVEALAPYYRILDIDGVRLNRYLTVYFDTEDMALYMRHHAGNEIRHKVRSRQYVDSGISYFEVKHKTNKDRTIKNRFQTRKLASRTRWRNAGLSPFGSAKRLSGRLSAKLRNEFRRITLVNRVEDERVTIDVDLCFSTDERTVRLPGPAIIEVKQAGLNRFSPVVTAMRTVGIPQQGLSKYCLGVALLYDNVKHNNFKPKLRLVERLTKGSN